MEIPNRLFMSGERPQASEGTILGNMKHQWPNHSSHPLQNAMGASHQNAMGASHQNAVHSSWQTQVLNDPNFNLESLLAADLSSMYAAEYSQACQQPSPSSFPHYHPPYDASPLNSDAVLQLQFQTEYPPVAYYHEQQRPHSHSIATTSSFIPQPSRPLSAGYGYSPLPCLLSCKFQRAASGGGGERSLQVGSSSNHQHQYEQFISQPQLLHSSHLYHQQTTPTNLQTSHQVTHNMPIHHDPATAAPALAHQRSSCCQLNSDGTVHQVHQHQQPLSGQQLQVLPLHHFSQQCLLPQHHQSLAEQAPQQLPAQQQMHYKSLYIAFPPLIQQLEKTATHQSTQTKPSAATPIAPPLPSAPPPHSDPSLPLSSPASHTPVPSPPLPSSALASLTPVPSPPLPSSALASLTPVPSPPLPSSALASPNYHSANSPDTPERSSYRNINRMRLFAQHFKELRERCQYSQADIAKQVLIRYNFKTCEEQISLFETSSLAFEEMASMMKHLGNWILEVEPSQESSEELKDILYWLSSINRPRLRPRPRQKRTTISVQTKRALIKEFESNPKPSSKDLKAIAEHLCIKLEVVRVWFSNRRQIKKTGKINDNEDEKIIVEEEVEDDYYSGSSQGKSSESDTQPSQ